MLNANVARIADILEWRAQIDYAQWTTSPEDARRQVARNQRDGLVPPPFPVIEPVAARPPSVHAELVAIYEELRERFSRPSGRRPATRQEFDRAAGIEDEIQAS